MNKIPTKRISIIWDFDNTLTSQDSTTEFIKYIIGERNISNFWKYVKVVAGINPQSKVNSISSSEAPVWMYFLSEMVKIYSIPLNKEFFGKIIANKICFYPEVLKCFENIKNLANQKIYQRNHIEINHFIITAGLEDLVCSVFEHHNSSHLIRQVFGCRYKVIKDEKGEIRNIPIYCMDKTIKTRSLFEISKGCFEKTSPYKVDDLVFHEDEWCHFEDIIYIGDGDTDIPSFSLVKSKRGMTVAVFDPSQSKEKREEKAKNFKKGERIDLFTPADFKEDGELFDFIKIRCKQIAQKYDAHTIYNI